MADTGLLELIISLLPSVFLLSFFVWIYFSGKRKNKKLLKKHFKQLEESKFTEYVQEFILKEGATANYRSYTCKAKPATGLKDFEIHFSMEDRQSMVNAIIAFFKGSKDFIVIEGDLPNSKSIFGLELIAWSEKNQREGNKELLASMEDFKVSEKFDTVFLVKTTHPVASGHFFKESRKFLGMIFAAREFIMRVSLQKLKSPNLRVLTRLNKKTNLDLLCDIFINALKNVDTTASKNFIKKTTKTGKRKK
ncbi:MAG: hypothetical protein ACXAEU_05620 [Candidatus Hodarchaeales archaeon]|jgi:hypothetical protein